MAQHPWTPMDATVDDGVTLVDNLNQAFPAVYSNHAGNSIPTGAVQGQFWVDTATLPVLTIKQYDGAVWRELWTVNVADGTLGGPFAGGGGGGGASVTISATPPASPKTGDLWFDSVRLNTFVYYEDADSSQWVQIVPTSPGLSQDIADDRYVNLTGDTMTGDLTISKSAPEIRLNKPASGTSAKIEGQTNGVMRWAVSLGADDPESGSNAGSKFGIYRYSDAGALLGPGLEIARSSGTVTMPGIVRAGIIEGPTGNGGLLRTLNGTSTIQFDWYSSGVTLPSFNVNSGGASGFLCTATNAMAFSYAGGAGGPTGVTLNGFDFGGNLYGILVDALSDQRIKENIRDTEVDAVALVNSVPVRAFDIKAEVAAWMGSIGKTPEERAEMMANAQPAHVPLGFVTQELRQAVPEAVREPPPGHAQPEGSPLPDDCQTYSPEALVPYLWRAVQQLADRVAELENRTR